MDSTLRVWDLSSGKCMGVLSALNGGGGHVDAVTCLEYMPPDVGSQNPMAQQAYVASGGADGAVKLWSTTGTPVHSCMHTSMVTTMKTFKDSNGGATTPATATATTLGATSPHRYSLKTLFLPFSLYLFIYFFIYHRRADAVGGFIGRVGRSSFGCVDEDPLYRRPFLAAL
jgi:WD40 repeat protein